MRRLQTSVSPLKLCRSKFLDFILPVLAKKQRKKHIGISARIRVRQATPPVTATWAVWSDWTTCTVSCGGEGQTKRTRQCPLYGACGNPSDTVEKKFCGQEPCVTWGQWGEWGKCSTTCGTGGTVIRTRQCSVYGDKCVGDKTETKKCCCLPACPVWAAWQPWGACSTTCGPGQKIRTRQCSAYGGGCPGEKTESETCSVQPCCTPWTEWGSCSVSCGGGTQKRTQTCGVDTGKTVASGTSVGGYASKVKEEVLPCNNFTCPVWKPWTKATPCSQSCVSEEGKPPGVTVQSRECNFDTNYCVADKLTTAACKCDGPEKNTSNCNTFKCPRWQEWGTWSECSVSCTAGYGKGGFHTRNRECIVDKTYCVGEKLKTDLGCKCDKNCTTDGANATEPCNTFKCPKWQEWGSWSECSASCTAGYGTAGTHQQTRTCVNDAKYCVADKLETPACKCDGSGNRSESCNNFACPKWTEWSSWSECSASCTAGYGQSGTHTQTRECKIDTNYCKGDKLATSVCKCENNATTGEGANRTESCNKFACPQWSEWGSWSECSASCTSGYGSAGTHSQSRECKIDTTYCTGEKLNSSVCQCQKNSTTGEGGNRTEPCNKFACPKWTEWSKWTPCSVTCGGGQHSQSRECIIDKTYCVGEKLTTSACKCENNATTGEGANRTDSCNIFKCPGWSEWSSWGDCSLPCTSSVGVIGSHTRSRPCEVDSTYCKPEKLGNPECHCVGNQTETENCNNFACPTWNAWGKWSDCSLPCKANNSAAGTHIRERTCKVDSQANCSGGKTVKKAGKRVKREESSNNSTVDPCHCVGNESESESCNTFACPYWSEWSSWATCSVTCGGGTHQQTRKCITDSGYCTAEKLKNDTQCKCDGSPTNNETCSTDACPTYKGNVEALITLNSNFNNFCFQLGVIGDLVVSLVATAQLTGSENARALTLLVLVRRSVLKHLACLA